jgi:formate C-acetyltransferase
MAGDNACGAGASSLWNASENLPVRVKKLRDEYFSFYEREHFRNQAMPFTTGKSWDAVWSAHNWGVAPELMPFYAAVEDCLAACAREVKMPASFWRLPLPVRRAEFFRTVIAKHLPVQILDGELIVGAQFNTALSKTLTREQARKHTRLEGKWIKMVRQLHDWGIGNCGATPGHLICNYPKILNNGFEAVAADIRDAMHQAKKGPRRDQLQAMLTCCEAVPQLTERYANEAARLADNESDPVRRAELSDIAAICRKVPWKKPESFHEALQALWFTHMLVMAAESYPGPGVSYGRIDQYLYPFYKADLDSGALTRDQAKELLMCWWVKHNYAYDYQGFIGTNQGINSGFGQLITISGCGPNGEDLTNDLSWLMLDIIEDMNLLEPKPNVRLHKNTPPELLRRVCDMVAKAQGAPFLLNFDENSMRGLVWQGLPEDKVWDYAPVGCLENTLQGNDRSGTVDVNLNIAKAVELALNSGRDMATGKRIGPDTGDPAAFEDFETFFAAFQKQLQAIADTLLDCNDLADSIRAQYEPTPYVSVLMDGCVQSGKDITAGGAEYNFMTVEGIALATAVDSLTAIKSMVFDEQRLTMDEIQDAIRDNYEGHERTRTMLLNRAPKYGTDNDAADAMAERVNRFWCEHVFKRETPTGKRYRGGYLSWNYWISYAPLTAATPDGRPRGAFLSNGIGPVNGMDKLGPTAAMRSVGKVGLETAPNGASHTLSLSPSLVRDPEHIDKLAAMLRAYGRHGGTALQINMLDPETLIAAQNDPGAYQNLLVRVTGYNAYFVNLGKEIQNELIAREAGSL